ncbi:MAG: hypothetical protein NVS4B9_33770 [Ktedonobacteraceae bacterium]
MLVCNVPLSELGFGAGGQNARKFGATYYTASLHGGLPVFHGDVLGILHIPLLFTFDTIGSFSSHNFFPFKFHVREV